MKGINTPEIKYGFWLGLGIIGALTLLMLIRRVLSGSLSAASRKKSQ